MAWHIIYEAAGGRPVSETGDAPDVAALAARGLAVLTLPARPTAGEMWEAAGRRMVARPPKVARDRIADLQADARFGTFNAVQKARILGMLADHFEEVRRG